jgi:hypothetical protein
LADNNMPSKVSFAMHCSMIMYKTGRWATKSPIALSILHDNRKHRRAERFVSHCPCPHTTQNEATSKLTVWDMGMSRGMGFVCGSQNSNPHLYSVHTPMILIPVTHCGLPQPVLLPKLYFLKLASIKCESVVSGRQFNHQWAMTSGDQFYLETKFEGVVRFSAYNCYFLLFKIN